MKSTIRKSGLSIFTGWLLFTSSSCALATLSILDTPLIATQVTKPMTMLVSGKDHKLFFEAYNDASDVDGDGTIDIRFKPSITYYGLFDSGLCYKHNNGDTNAGLFSPDSKAVANKCPGKWSGNFLNYVTTSRIDALRKVLYGGYREVDTATQTILRRAYIPQDAHSWGKEYTSEAVDGYKISDYTPLNQPAGNKRHLFGSLTANITTATNCAVLSNCSNLPPLFVTVENSTSRVWEWASSENPVLNGSAGGTRKDRTVRIEVCTANFHDGCKQYPNLAYKPIGLLHDYGENDSMLFGLLTGSYDKNMSGGVLRKVVSSFTDEVDKNTGLFTSDNTIVKTFNNLRIRDHNNGATGGAYRNGSRRDRVMTEGEFVDWGNPMGEMMYETLRYFAGKAVATTAFSNKTGAHDAAVGLSEATWDNPYDTTNSKAKAPWCAKPNMLVISDTNVSYDSNQLPGSSFATFSGDLAAMDVSALAKTITDKEDEFSAALNLPELKITGSHFIGQSTLSNFDSAPTAKYVNNLATVRGLAPDEPNKEGSYYSGAVAYFGKTNDLNTAANDQKVDAYVVALASPLPKIEVTISGHKISLVPFAKTVDGTGGGAGSGANVDRTKGKYQPTDGLLDFYLDTIANTNSGNMDPTVNSGRPYIKFRINYEADEQGNDYDMDVIAEYVVQVEANATLSVKVKVTYESTGSNQNIGYVISGTNRDGVYLVAQDKNEDTPYFLNVPPLRNPGYCDVSPLPMPNDCKKLPYLGAAAPNNESTQTFSPGATTAASVMKDPLWYAAKWGGFLDKDKSNQPNLPFEWDSNGDGNPDTYNLVQNPLKLKESLKRSFDSIVERSASAGNITSNGQEVNGGDRVFQPSFNSLTWDGELQARQASNLNIVMWTASGLIPPAASRKIFSWNSSNIVNGVPFEWNQIDIAHQTLLGTQDVLNYLRGDQTKEIQNTGAFRNRSKILGDIVHSSPYFVKDTNMVFVGANDGMLHAFSADTGIESFAYVPSVIYDKLKDLSSPYYSHKFYVDGDIAVSSQSLTPGKNLLVASLGRGAKALFGLNVTHPGSFANSDVLWELNNNNDLGFVLGRPQVARLNNDVAAAVVGNGYNSTNGSAVLFIINLETGAIIKTIDTLATGDNGLATPTLVDTNNDGKADYVYAGDLKGNVWKFDLSNADTAQWKLVTATPMFVAKDVANNRQPITAQILVTVDNLKDDPNIGKTFLLFGTGSYYFSTDPENQAVQTLYGIIDDGSAITARSQLTARTIATLGTSSGKSVRVFSDAVKSPNDMTGKNGWFLDLIDGTPPTAKGERVVTAAQVIMGIEPALVVSSIIPVVGDVCNPEGRGYINALNAFTGASLTDYFFDVSGNGSFDASDMLNGKYVGSIDLGIGMPGQGVLVDDKFIVGGSKNEIGSIGVNKGFKRTGRVSWREIKLQ
jgi:type IV pilus assembly protein PilY1